MLNKFLIPAALVATVVIAGIFAFMPVEKASTVHGTLATATSLTATDANVDAEIDAQDRGINFVLNVTEGKGRAALIPSSSGAVSGSFVMTASPSSNTGGAVFECGIEQGAALTGTNASHTGNVKTVGSGTFTIANTEALWLQVDETSSNSNGVCAVTLIIDSSTG